MVLTILYVIVFLLALIISNILNKVFPKLALPLIQVVIGLILGFFGADKILQVEPLLFLGFVIGPLLFREAEEADAKSLFKHTKLIMVLIFPLVFLTASVLGYVTHTLYGIIPLAACFALGAALAPTDAVAVGALSQNLKFPKRIMAVLKGEGLLNDASGIISFQLAVLALTTGYFSFFYATSNLITAALGGAAIGLGLVYFKTLLLRILEDVDARDLSGYLMLEFVIPLAAFLIAEEFHFSGIIAVVVAGIMQANGLKKTTLFDAQITKVKHTIWETMVFILNSIVFLFLGIELYQLVVPLIISPLYNTTWLLILALILTIGLFTLRFLMLCLFFFIKSIKAKQGFLVYWNDILLLTFAGSKGTVSIATILLLPKMEDGIHTILIFLVTAVTGLSFLIGLFILPFFAAQKEKKINNLTKISLLNDVVEELRKDMLTSKHVESLNIAIDSYQERIQKLIIEQESADTSIDFNELQLLIVRLESEGLEHSLKHEEISMYTYRTYRRYLRSLEQSVAHSLVSSLQFALIIAAQALHLILSHLLHIEFQFKKTREVIMTTRDQITELYFKNTELILQALENLEGVYDVRLINFLQAERIRTAEQVAKGGHITRMMNKAQPNNMTEMMRAYYLERKSIFEYEARGDISKTEAKLLRQNVNVMEDYSLSSDHQTLLYDFLEQKRKQR